MPGHRRPLCLRALHVLVATSLLLALCTPPVAAPQALAASGPTEPAGPVAADELVVTVDPPEAQPGELVTVSVRIQTQRMLPNAVLTASLGPGLGFEAAQGGGAQFDGATRRLRWPLGRLEADQAGVWRFTLRVQDGARDVTCSTIELQAADGRGLAVAEAIVRRPFPAASARVTPGEGGELRSADGRVRVTFPKGAVGRTARVEHRPRSADRLAPGQAGMALEFELNAFDDATGAAVHRFEQPLQVQVDLSGLVDLDALPAHQYYHLSYLKDDGQWEGVRAVRNGSVLYAAVDHFTLYGCGTDNVVEKGWLLSYNEPTVSPFDGGFHYEYPIEVPAGRGGLTPSLGLSYDSRRVDGILTWAQADWAGLGWSVDTMEIVRKFEPDYSTASGEPAWIYGWFAYQNEFTLIYNGTSYRLKPDKKYPAFAYYRAEDEQFLEVVRYNAWGGSLGFYGSPVNTTSEYWIVRLRDGTQYRLGYNGDSEQSVLSRYYSTECPGGCRWTSLHSPPLNGDCYAGDEHLRLAFRWRVDQIRDTRGNVVRFSYYEPHESEGTCAQGREAASYLETVSYNFDPTGANPSTRVRFVRLPRPKPGEGGIMDGVSCSSSSCCVPFFQQEYLSEIVVENLDGGEWHQVRKYRLAYMELPPAGEPNKHIRLLQGITAYGRPDGQGVSPALPATTFGYTNKQNKGAGGSTTWTQSKFSYARLTSVSNGYGGVTTVAYATPDTVCCDKAWNYRVTTKTVSDGMAGGRKVSYTYAANVSDRCYDDNKDRVCEFKTGSTGGALVGYRTVTETLKTMADAVVGSTRHEFKLNSVEDPSRDLGRELCMTQKDAAGAELHQIQTTWTVYTGTVPGTSTPNYFTYASAVDELWPVGGSLPGTPQVRTEYDYDTQTGNLTATREYQAGALYRQTETSYCPDGGYPITDTVHFRNLIDKPFEVVIKDAAGAPLSKTRYYYDDLPLGEPPLRGNLTAVERATDPGAGEFITTQTITYGGPFWLPVAEADANGHERQIAYDAEWRYPASITNALSQTTTLAYDRVLGAITQVTGPNGAATATRYEYDPFGRLSKIVRPGDSSMYPTLRYEYCDTCSPLRIGSYARVSSGEPAELAALRFYNGLGQLIEESQGTSDQSQMRVTHLTYNAQGLQAQAYVPYTAAYSTGYVALDTGKPKTSYAYDALGRSTTITNTDGTVVRTFYEGTAGGTRTTAVDENGHQRVSDSDAFGRLVQVQEYSGAYPNATLYATTHYGYNPLDLLTGVTDALGNQTSIAYDALGRKTAMTDPDMGAWSYAYDPAGNLLRQTDAKGQSTFFAYDELDRLTGKAYGEGSVYPDPFVADVSYTYDDTTAGNPGLGYRTGMSDPSGSTAWRYDVRGRVAEERKTVSGAGTFATQWTYGARDQVLTQTYPGGSAGQLGEVVTTGYGVWGQADTLSGASAYVTGAPLTGDGRLDLVKLGGTPASPTLQVDYTYYPWTTANGRGRLQQIASGPPAQPAALQDLRYSYDPVGNVTSIQDWVAGGPETQSFTYDHLDRLTGVSGAYADAYTYSEIGNLTGKGGDAGYAYDAQKAHAVRSVTGTAEPVTTTITIWARGVTGDGTDPQMALIIDGSERATWSVAAGESYTPYFARTPLTGDDVFEVCYTNDNAARELWVDAVMVGGPAPLPYHASLPAVRHAEGTPEPAPAADEGVTIQAEGGAMLYGKGTEATAFQSPNVAPGQERLDQGGALRFVVGDAAYAAEYDANGNMTSRVVTGQAQVLGWDAENRLVGIRQGTSVSTFVYDADGNRVKATVDGVTTVYIGGYYEETAGTVRTYYYRGGQRVAMREAGVTTWLLSDHLGSTSVAYVEADGDSVNQGYYAWGAIRPGPENELPTDYTFTGQKLDERSGLMYYVARWYDRLVGRFLSPDSIVPEPGNPQSLNRFAYAYNSPLRYTDPTGHYILLEGTPGQRDEFGVAYVPSGRLSIVHGGSHFRNYVEVAVANYELALEAGQNPDVPSLPVGGAFRATIKGSVAVAHRELNGGSGGGGAFSLFDAGWVAGVGQLGAKALVGLAELGLPAIGGIAAPPAPQVGATVYRVYGQDFGDPDAPGSKPWGPSWTPVDPRSVGDYRSRAGLPNKNRGRFVIEGTITDASGIQVREALSADGNPGGLEEWWVPNPQMQIEPRGVFGVNPPY